MACTIRDTLLELMDTPPVFGKEHFKGAAADYNRLAPDLLASLAPVKTIKDDSEFISSKYVSYSYRENLLKLVSQECAAGASARRCRQWFKCMALLAAQVPGWTKEPVCDREGVIYFALSQDFCAERYRDWPDEPRTRETSIWVLYALMTQKELLHEGKMYHDDRHWLKLYEAIKNKDETAAKAAYIALADYWLKEYEANDQMQYEPGFPSFEPDCSAILAIGLFREKFSIQFEEERHRLFYHAVLIEEV